MHMKQVLAVILCAVLPGTMFAANDNSYKVAYDGGSIPDLKAGSEMKLTFDSTQILLVKNKKKLLLRFRSRQ